MKAVLNVHKPKLIKVVSFKEGLQGIKFCPAEEGLGDNLCSSCGRS